MKGTIERIRVYPEKGAAGRDLTEGRLIEGLGLEGDFHAVGGERQISLLLADIYEETMAGKEKGLCFSRFKENLFIRRRTPANPGSGETFPEFDGIRPGLELFAGEAILKITGETKHCHEECSLYRQGRQCPLAGMNLFAKVEKSGIIGIGTEIGLT